MEDTYNSIWRYRWGDTPVYPRHYDNDDDGGKVYVTTDSGKENYYGDRTLYYQPLSRCNADNAYRIAGVFFQIADRF